MMSDYVDAGVPSQLVSDRKGVGSSGKNLMVPQGSTFIRRQGIMNQTVARGFLKQSQESSQPRDYSNRSSVNRDSSQNQKAGAAAEDET